MLSSQIVKYIFVGSANTAFGLIIIYSIQIIFSTTPYQSNFFGYLLCNVISFATQGSLTFKTELTSYSLLRYLFITSLLWALNIAVLRFFLELGVNPYLSQFAAVAAYASLGFILHKYFTFSSHRF